MRLYCTVERLLDISWTYRVLYRADTNISFYIITQPLKTWIKNITIRKRRTGVTTVNSPDHAAITIWARGHGRRKLSKIPISRTVNTRIRNPWIGTYTKLILWSVLGKRYQIEKLLLRMTWLDLATPDILDDILCYCTHRLDVNRCNAFNILPASLVDKSPVGARSEEIRQVVHKARLDRHPARPATDCRFSTTC